MNNIVELLNELVDKVRVTIEFGCPWGEWEVSLRYKSDRGNIEVKAEAKTLELALTEAWEKLQNLGAKGFKIRPKLPAPEDKPYDPRYEVKEEIFF